jgi:multidrug efflux pump subunit AcrA (membrane-fusion protein)
MNKKYFILATALALAGCGQQGAEEKTPATDFETMTVSKQDITLEQSYPAQIEGRQSIKIIPRVEGYLHQICVKEGQRNHTEIARLMKGFLKRVLVCK